MTPEQVVYYTLKKSQKTSFLIDYAYKFRKSMQTGQQRFRDASLRPDEIEYFLQYVQSRNWCSTLDIPEGRQYQLTVFSQKELYEIRKPMHANA